MHHTPSHVSSGERAQISEFRQTGMADEFRNPFNYNVGKVALLTPPVFLPTGNSLVSYVWQRGPTQAQRSIAVEGPGRGIPRVVVTCTWRGCARESVSRFEVLRVNPWILFVWSLGCARGGEVSPGASSRRRGHDTGSSRSRSQLYGV